MNERIVTVAKIQSRVKGRCECPWMLIEILTLSFSLLFGASQFSSGYIFPDQAWPVFGCLLVPFLNGTHEEKELAS